MQTVDLADSQQLEIKQQLQEALQTETKAANATATPPTKSSTLHYTNTYRHEQASRLSISYVTQLLVSPLRYLAMQRLRDKSEGKLIHDHIALGLESVWKIGVQFH